ncbi:small G protein signaling modulator 1-like [Impatiens glandulifera]|uniref:small G protein signaling modulator 1-like n=1 Tax=Impatiens glandulifera TaxID=253017 RepID=UPI001FB04FBE|nr:small G protein signaling modulator 1-like [Impatiens glandulifera]
MMSDEDNKQWICGKGRTVNLHRFSSVVRDIGEPCLHQSPIKVIIAISRMLKPDKWQSTFDDDGKAFGFSKVLKSIIAGGVDPSIRAEVWEFLLGCYSISSTTEHRNQLRTARRERYGELVKQCQMMHSSIGTGSLAYVVGSKVMDVRTISKDEGKRDTELARRHTSDDDTSNSCTDTSYPFQRENSIASPDLVSVRKSTDSAAYDSSFYMATSGPCNPSSQKLENDVHEPQYVIESYFDFPPLPVTNLFEKSHKDKRHDTSETRHHTESKVQYDDDGMHSFRINNNIDIVMEANSSAPINSEIELILPNIPQPLSRGSNMEDKTGFVNRLRLSETLQTSSTDAATFKEGAVNDERVSEWLWTLHRIVVDVVRTDSHLEFYEDKKNLARMSDILAVYAWVDPATGYCQGMSDLLSPFVVLFEDNADAFWCFEMLIRRMRENFQMEGPTGVMKQLEVLGQILELTDREMFAHLTHIGAESFHFAFRMLLVLFRRELSFDEALCMWEMMWAADFDESLAHHLEENCLEPLIIRIPSAKSQEDGTLSADDGNLKSSPQLNIGNVSDNDSARSGPPSNGNDNGSGVKSGPLSNHANGNDNGRVKCGLQPNSDSDGVRSASSTRPFCGLSKGFWSKSDRFHTCTIVSSSNCEDELSVFCVAAILFTNRQKIIRETCAIDDLIKIFNDGMFKFRVKRCIHTAIKLRKKYYFKLKRNRSPVTWDDD